MTISTWYDDNRLALGRFTPKPFGCSQARLGAGFHDDNTPKLVCGKLVNFMLLHRRAEET